MCIYPCLLLCSDHSMFMSPAPALCQPFAGPHSLLALAVLQRPACVPHLPPISIMRKGETAHRPACVPPIPPTRIMRKGETAHTVHVERPPHGCRQWRAAKGRLAGQVTCCNAGRPSRRETLHAVELPRQSDSELGSAHCAQHLLPLPMPESKWLSWPGGRPLAAIGATLPAPGAEIPEKPSNLSSLIKR